MPASYPRLLSVEDVDEAAVNMICLPLLKEIISKIGKQMFLNSLFDDIT